MDFPTTSGQNSVTPPPSRPTGLAGTTPVVPPTRENDTIYTMPDKFMQSSVQPQTTKSHSKTKTWVLIVVIALAVIAIIGGVVYYVLSGLQQQTPVESVVENNTAVTNETNITNTTSNQNSNSNALAVNSLPSNGNSNANSNGNVNTNVANVNNANSNTNAATNANSNVNTNAPVAVPSKDTDKDKLTNEEEVLFSTKADKPDTDSDGYIDGEEIVAGYDPNNSVSSGRLSASSKVTTYEASDYGYSIMYPSGWLAQALSAETPNEMLFTSQSVDTAGQFIEVLVEDNSTGYTATDWYTSQTGGSEATLLPITTFEGMEGVMSSDGYTAYFTDSKRAYVISYRFGSSTEVYFPSTFTFMAKSFKQLKGAKTSTNGNTNTINNTNNTNQTKTNNNANSAY